MMAMKTTTAAMTMTIDEGEDAAAPIAPAPVTPRPQGGILKATPKAVVE